MADPRPQHFHYKSSLMNTPTEPFNGPGAALYGPRGPTRSHNTGRRRPLSTPPMSLEHHIQDAIAKVPDLSPRQKLALRNTFMTLTRDIGFIKLITESAHAHGPWSEAATHLDSQGNVITG
jgi:hypothetical protein